MPPSSPPPLSPETLLSHITAAVTHLLLLLLSTTTTTALPFPSRFRLLHSKLILLSTSLSSLSPSLTSSSHHHHPLLVSSLLPPLLSTLRRLESLTLSASDSSFSGGKLKMQSDLDMATAALTEHVRDLELILRAGILYTSSAAAIVVSKPGLESDREDLVFYVRDLFARLQIGGVGFKEEAIESLLLLLETDERSAEVVAKEGNVSYLIQLLEYGNCGGAVREKAVGVIAVLAAASEVSREAVFEEGGLGPLLRILDSGTLGLREKAAAAIEALMADPENAWAVAAYGGVRILIDACRCGSSQIEASAVGAVRNVLVVEEMRDAFVEENVIPVLIEGLDSGDGGGEDKATECLSILASSNERFRSLIVQHRGVQRLMQSIHDSSNLRTLEHALAAIRFLSISSDPICKHLSRSTGFVIRLSDLIIRGNVAVQLIAASLVSSLSISDGNKRAMASCMPVLVKLIEMPKPGGIASAASAALVSLLAVKSNRKELTRDEKSVRRLVQAMDVENESVSKEYPVAVVTAMVGGGNEGCRRRLVAAGALAAAQRLEAMEVIGARKAAARLAGNRLRSIFSRSWRA